MRTLRIAAFSVLVLPVACAPDARPEDDPGDADTAQGVLVEELRIGSREDPDQAFTRIGRVLPFPDLRVWVTDLRQNEILAFDADGRLLRRIGRAGRGPGEFSMPGAMGWWRGTRDTLWVSDPLLGRVTLFTAGGDVARDFALAQVRADADRSITEPAAFTTDGSALAIARYAPGVTAWESFPLLRYDPVAGAIEREVARLDRVNEVLITWRGRAIASAAHPLADAPLVAYAPDGSRVAIVERAPAPAAAARGEAHVTVHMLDASGERLWSRPIRTGVDEVPRAVVDSLYTARIRSFREFTRLERQLSDDEAEAAYRASVRMPGHYPAVRSILLGDDGRLWIQSGGGGDSAGHWWVVAADGRRVHRVRELQRLNLRAATATHVWAVDTDELNVPFVVRYRIHH